MRCALARPPAASTFALAACIAQEVGDKLTFVIVRPGGLKSEPATGTGVLTGAWAPGAPQAWWSSQAVTGGWYLSGLPGAEDTTVCGSITREDVANLVVKALRRCDCMPASHPAAMAFEQGCSASTLPPPPSDNCSDAANGKVLSAVDKAALPDVQFEVFTV